MGVYESVLELIRDGYETARPRRTEPFQYLTLNGEAADLCQWTDVE